MLAAARKYKRVVQVGTQRRSTPHLIEARDRIIREGKLGTIGLVEIYCYYHMRATQNPPDATPPANLDYEMWTGPAPMRPYNALVHPRRWRAFMEYGNGIVGDMCIHMLDMVRWMLDLGWPTRIASVGRHPGREGEQGRTSPTRRRRPSTSATCRSSGRIARYGPSPDPKYPWGATIYGDKGTLKASVMSYDFTPTKGEPIHEDVKYELEEYPDDKTEKDLEKHVAPAIRGHMKDLLTRIADARQAGRRHRAGLHLGDVVHPGQHVAEARPVADLGSRQGRGRRRRRGEQGARPSVSRALQAPRREDGLGARVLTRPASRVSAPTRRDPGCSRAWSRRIG